MQIINPDLFSFFSKLKENNNRDWFQSNKTEFKLLEGQVKLFMKQIEENLQIHDKIEKIMEILESNYKKSKKSWILMEIIENPAK